MDLQKDRQDYNVIFSSQLSKYCRSRFSNFEPIFKKIISVKISKISKKSLKKYDTKIIHFPIFGINFVGIHQQIINNFFNTTIFDASQCVHHVLLWIPVHYHGTFNSILDSYFSLDLLFQSILGISKSDTHITRDDSKILQKGV